MSERYVIYGTQIGMLKFYLKHGQINDADNLIDKIEEQQFLFNKGSKEHVYFLTLIDRLVNM